MGDVTLEGKEKKATARFCETDSLFRYSEIIEIVHANTKFIFANKFSAFTIKKCHKYLFTTAPPLVAMQLLCKQKKTNLGPRMETAMVNPDG